MKRESLYLLLLVAVLMTASRQGMARPVGGVERTKANTGGASWRAERIAALGRAGVIGDLARAVVAHWDLETGAGAGEWNFNVGNIVASAGQAMFELDTSSGAMWFRAFDNLDQGVAAYLLLLRTRYPECWAMLHAAPTSDQWVRCLVAHGYAGKASPDTYASAWADRLAKGA